MSVMYYFQKQTNDPANTQRKGYLRTIIREITDAVGELQQEILKLNELKDKLETILVGTQMKS